MPVKVGSTQDPKTIAQLKERYISFFRDCPIQKYAAQYIGRDADTICTWQNNDPIFADKVKEAESDFIRKRLLQTKAEFPLERLYPVDFPEPTKKTDLTSGGEKLEGLTVIKADDSSA